MSRAFQLIAVILALSGMGAPSLVQGQGFSGLARIDPTSSRIEDRGTDEAEIVLSLSQGVPYRLFTLTNPPRLVLDFQEVDWRGLTSETLLQGQLVRQAQFGTYVPGWSRMVLELAEPLKVQSAALDIDAVTTKAELKLKLTRTSDEMFAANAGAPTDPRWDLPEAEVLPGPITRGGDAPLLVVLDPGHGGIDPGAERDGAQEKDLMLLFARELRDVLRRAGGFEVVLTRDEDAFVSLEGRVAIAHRAQADVFLSLHADSLSQGNAKGATIYTLSEEASDTASA